MMIHSTVFPDALINSVNVLLLFFYSEEDKKILVQNSCQVLFAQTSVAATAWHFQLEEPHEKKQRP